MNENQVKQIVKETLIELGVIEDPESDDNQELLRSTKVLRDAERKAWQKLQRSRNTGVE